MSEQPGQGDGATGRDTAPAPTGGGPASKGGDPARSGMRALWLGAGAILLTPFFFPIGLVLAIAALVVGIRARRLGGRTRTPASGAVAGIVLGSIGLAIATLWTAVYIVLWPEMSRYQECLSSANTTTDETACRDRYFGEIERKLDLPGGSMSRYGDLL